MLDFTLEQVLPLIKENHRVWVYDDAYDEDILIPIDEEDKYMDWVVCAIESSDAHNMIYVTVKERML